MDDHIDIHDAARRLGISVRTARRWIKAGALPAQLRGGRHGLTYAIPLAAVAATIAQRPASEPPTGSDDFQQVVDDLRRAVAALRSETQQMREDLAALRALLPISQGGEQREDELVGPRQRRDDCQAEEQRAREAE